MRSFTREMGARKSFDTVLLQRNPKFPRNSKCQFSQEKRNHDPQIVTKNNRVYLNSRLRNQISQRGIDTLGLLPPYEM